MEITQIKYVGTPGTIGYKYQQIKELRAIRVKLCRAVVLTELWIRIYEKTAN